MTELDRAVWLLRATPTHEHREEHTLRRWARIALDFGRELAHTARPPDIPVHRVEGGHHPDELVLAEYRPNRPRILLYTDAIIAVQDILRGQGPAETFPPEIVEAAAIAHEQAHHRLHGTAGRELRHRLDHTALTLGRIRLRGHVLGADEIAAHSYARHVLGGQHCPLRLTQTLSRHLAATRS
ncbi:hypothetical protein [Crossiella sp. CA198]|uniref:hypothetical protein n=1 Tax=Crossiella sp. CA198 TaxID=3455607 RepID=UPI003F8D3E1C